MDVGSVNEYDFMVYENKCVARGIWRMRIDSHVSWFLDPGQFMNLQIPGDASHILRVPLSFIRADRVHSKVDLLYAVVGEGTRRLSQMQVGDISTLLGPCGKGWRLPEKEGRALLVSGGIGLPPIVAAARMLAEHGIGFDAVCGYRTSSVIPWADEEALMHLVDHAGRIVTCTDDGSAGKAGFTTEAMRELLDEHTYAQVYTCGPNVMMAGVARLAAEHDVPCQASLERMMGCGFGACSCCNVALVSGGYALCCTDGPVFDAKEVAW